MIKNKLLNARIEKGFSQKELAEKIGMSQTSYSKRENGTVAIEAEEWQRLAKIFNKNVEDIFEENKTFTSHNKNNKGGNNGCIINNQLDTIIKEYQNQLNEQKEQYEKRLIEKDNEITFLRSLVQKETL